LTLRRENDVVKVLKSAYTKIHNSEEIDEFAIKDAARKIVDYAREYRDRGISMLSTDVVDEYVVEHSVKCGDNNCLHLETDCPNTFNQLCDLVSQEL